MDRRLPSRLARSLGACAPVLGLLIASSTGSASAARVPGNARSAALAVLKHVVIGEHGTTHVVSTQADVGGFGPKKVHSGDWSGYADGNSENYSTVTAHWTEPTVTGCSTQSGDTMAAFWVGIDGYGSTSVEQDGSLAYCYQRKVYYYTWWEMYPSNGIQPVGTSVEPGDQITASVTRVGTKYTLKVIDAKHTDNSFTENETCAKKTCTNASAEWVAEAPTGTSGQYPLSDFGTWRISNATVKTSSQAGTISTFPDYFITMTSDSTVLAKPGPLNHSGSSFTDTWLASS
jgi:hypothetical protein